MVVLDAKGPRALAHPVRVQLIGQAFVEEDAERGNARERWWRSVYQSTWFNDPALAEREPEAALTYLHSVATTYTLRTQQALDDTRYRRDSPEEATSAPENAERVSVMLHVLPELGAPAPPHSSPGPSTGTP